jgi:cytochrome P450
MLHDPAVYPDPFTFDPLRLLDTVEKAGQRDPRLACFGFARRICPGMHLAEASLWILVAMSLAVFDITKAVENGVPITPVHENTSGIIR